jgi:hypothetical protein
MKKLLISSLLLILAGCASTTPHVEVKFPDIPAELNIACPELKEIPQGTSKLSVVIGVVSDNYAEYHRCKNRQSLWKEWYEQQKKIFDSVK